MIIAFLTDRPPKELKTVLPGAETVAFDFSSLGNINPSHIRIQFDA